MYAQVEKTNEKKGEAIANSVTHKKNHRQQEIGLVDNWSELMHNEKCQ